MKKLLIIILLIVLLLTTCKSNSQNEITLNDVLTSLEEQKLELKKNKINNDNIFGSKLNGVKPDSYDLDAKPLFIYIFDSIEERKEGLEDFRQKTASFNVVSYEMYEVKNVLLFYVHGQDLNIEVEVDNEIKEALNQLN